jgi:hypothetical protein
MNFYDDLAQMHADCDEEFGLEAAFRPAAGGAYPCRVELFQPEPEIGLADGKTVQAEILLRVTKSSLPIQPKRGDVFEVATADYDVLAKPTTEDDDGLRWTIKAAKVRK